MNKLTMYCGIVLSMLSSLIVVIVIIDFICWVFIGGCYVGIVENSG